MNLLTQELYVTGWKSPSNITNTFNRRTNNKEIKIRKEENKTEKEKHGQMKTAKKIQKINNNTHRTVSKNQSSGTEFVSFEVVRISCKPSTK